MNSSKRVESVKEYDLSIGGHALTIFSDQDHLQIQKIASYANERLKESLNKDHSFQKSLMLALLQISEEVISLRSKLGTQVEHLEHRTQQIIEQFEHAIDG